jgi:hypothetical protein
VVPFIQCYLLQWLVYSRDKSLYAEPSPRGEASSSDAHPSARSSLGGPVGCRLLRSSWNKGRAKIKESVKLKNCRRALGSGRVII